MPEGLIPYAHLVETALMGVVRGVLADVAVSGLDDPHHFYITFRTDHPGVEMPTALRQRYKQEMTIVLQHQFWDLSVDEDRFAVTLSFGGRPQRLIVPFTAIKVFADPGVEFGLQFTLADAQADGDVEADGDDVETGGARVLPSIRTEADLGATPDDGPADATPGDADDKPAGGADIVTLDRFRKR